MKPVLLWLSLCLLSMPVFAQITIKGVITDQNKAPIPGVNIIELGTQNGVSTDANGVYSIQVKDQNAMLSFSFIGFYDESVQVGSKTTLNIMLRPNSELLDEVVITALGLERDPKNLGYVIQKLETKQVSEVKSPNFVDNLAGQVAGVTVSQGATGVGSSSKITIRGEASFTNNNPLFVVDGVPINNNSIINYTTDAASGFQEIDFGNGAMEVNPDDIASVSVLKGPAAAALYGTRASNGVILIETKSGATKQGVGVSINSSTFVDRAFKLPEFQNKYGQGNSGEFEYVDGLGGGVNDVISYSYGPQLDAGILVPQYDSPVTMPDGSMVRGGDIYVHGGLPITPTEFVSHPDNLKNFYQTGYTTMNNAAVTSGFDKGDFRLSFTDMRSESIIPGVNLDRQTVSSRLNFRPTSKLKISTSLSYINSASDNRPANGYGSENVNYALVAWGPRSLNINNMKDYWQPGLEGLEQYSFNYTYFDNPYFTLLENRNSFQRDRFFGNVLARYQFTENLSAQARTGMDYSTELRKFSRAYSSNRFQNGAYAEHQVSYRENNTDLLLNYKKLFGDFLIDISAGANRMDQSANNAQTQALSLAQPGVYSLSNSAIPLETIQYTGRKRINSVYGLINLGYKDFLFVDVTGRNDWSSALATPTSAANASFFYPSVSSSFILSNVLDLPSYFSFAKLRASVAQVGNDTDPYQTTGAFVSSAPYASQPTFTDQNFIANANLLPEKTSSIEFGADVRFFKDRLNIDVTYYDAHTQNQIISLPVPISSGYTQQVVNGGLVRSRGVEIMLGVVPVIKGEFQWSSFFNFSRNISTVEEIPAGLDNLTLAYNRVYDNVNQTVWVQVEEGGRIGDLYGTGYKKTDDGKFILDANGNYIVDNDLRKLGNYNPDFMLGWSNNFSWKNWNASMLIDWRQGGVIVSRTQALAGVAGQLIETADRPEAGIVAEGVVNAGTDENPVYETNTKAIPAESYYRQYYDRNHEENNTLDASYVKLRSVSIGYTFRGKAESTGFFGQGRSMQVSLIGRNLFALSHIKHFDPEQLAVQGNQFVSGVEDMSYATSRSMGVKLNLNF